MAPTSWVFGGSSTPDELAQESQEIARNYIIKVYFWTASTILSHGIFSPGSYSFRGWFNQKKTQFPQKKNFRFNFFEE